MSDAGAWSASAGTRIPVQSRRFPIRFSNNYGTYSGLDAHGRRWLINPSPTGWRLEFMDPGDQSPTYASTHATMRDAERHASR